jgi:hypothetical protein
MPVKSFTNVRIKDADQGLVEAVFSTFDVVDKDGDVTRKGAFTDGADVVISAYGHQSWDGELPIGKGVIRVRGDEAILEGQFFLDTAAGKDTFTVVKELGDLQEWSYSLEEVEAERGDFNGKNVRFLNKITVKETSPVLRGAGVDTRTLAVKQQKQLTSMIARMLDEAGSARWGGMEYGYCYLDDFDVDDDTAVFCITDYSMGERERYRLQVDFTRTDTSVTLGDTETQVEYTTVYLPKSGARFSEQADIALRGVAQLVETAVERLTLRATEGKSFAEQIGAYDQLVAGLVPLKAAIDTATQPSPDDEARQEYLRFVAAHLQGAST